MTVVPGLLSYVSGVSRVPLLDDTIGDNIDRTVARHGDRTALVDCPSGRRWSYSQLCVVDGARTCSNNRVIPQ